MRALLTTIILLSATTYALAEQKPVQSLTEGGRYQLMEINDKVVRLDTQSGSFDVCSAEQGSWDCKVAHDRSRDRDQELADLTKRVEVLEAALAKARKENELANRSIVSKLSDYVPGLN